MGKIVFLWLQIFGQDIKNSLTLSYKYLCEGIQIITVIFISNTVIENSRTLRMKAYYLSLWRKLTKVVWTVVAFCLSHNPWHGVSNLAMPWRIVMLLSKSGLASNIFSCTLWMSWNISENSFNVKYFVRATPSGISSSFPS